MSKVYFSKEIDKIIELIKNKIIQKGNIGIKVHFGEKGCKTYLNPEDVRKVYNAVFRINNHVKLIETNALYKGAEQILKST